MSLLTNAPSVEPASFSIGDSVFWRRDLAEYPASEYVVTYVIGPLTIHATADGESHLFQIGASSTLQLKPGIYGARMYATEIATGSRITLTPAFDRINVLSDPSTGTKDGRSSAERILAAVESALEKIASKTAVSVSVNGTSYTLANIDQLYKLRANLRNEVENEERARRLAAGLGASNKILVRFRGM